MRLSGLFAFFGACRNVYVNGTAQVNTETDNILKRSVMSVLHVSSMLPRSYAISAVSLQC